MIDPNLSFEGFDARSWTRLLSLFSQGLTDRLEARPLSSDDPESCGDGSSDSAGAVTLIVDDHDRLLKTFHSIRGRIRHARYEPGASLEMIAQTHKARRVLVLRTGVLEALFDEFSDRVALDDDYVTQWIAVAEALRDAIDRGDIRSWPRPLANVPIPSARAVRRAIDLVLPVHQGMAMVLWDEGEIWTAAVLRRGSRGIDRVVGPDVIRELTGPLGGDWRRDHRVVGRALGHELAPLHLGLFTEVQTMRNLLRQTHAGAWARALAVRDVVVYPSPTYVRVAAGADVAHAVFNRANDLLAGLRPLRILAPALRAAQRRFPDFASVTQTLGFNPLTALAQQVRGLDHSEDKAQEEDVPMRDPKY